MKLYGKLKHFHRGCTISLHTTFRCNLSCDYCTVKRPDGTRPTSKEATVPEMLAYIDRFPVKVKEVYITGGEPTIRPDLPELVNGLLDRGLFVVLTTNMANASPMLGIVPSVRFRIQATFHHDANRVRWFYHYRVASRIHRVDVDEIGTQRLSFSTVKPFAVPEDLETPMLRIAPDLTLWTSCAEMYRNK